MTFQNKDALTKTDTDTKAAGEGPAPEFLNRDLGWLEFNRRVLHEAVDARTPLLERLRFLGIVTSNLDEFFMKRVGGLKRQVAAGLATKAHEGMTPKQLLAAIRQIVVPILSQQAQCFAQEILPALRGNGIYLLKWNELSDAEKAKANKYFRENVFPVLTPLAVDPGHPFPFLSNLSKSLGVVLSHPDRDERLFARVKVPKAFPQWIAVHVEEGVLYRFVSLTELIVQNLSSLFPNMKILGVMPFRITRNADIERDEEDAEDLLEMIEEELRQRRFARIVRLEHGPKPDPWILQFLIEELDLSEDEIIEVPGELDYTDFKPVADIHVPKLKFEPWAAVIPAALADEDSNIFTAIRSNDILVHHPYESFSGSVEKFVWEAAVDPRVVAIKMTLYRTDKNSPFIQALVRAAEMGKQVVCLVELKARFDEERNIFWAQALESAGVHVVYGIVGLKTHAKMALVVRQDLDGLRSYVHIGTGNYHRGTAKLYSDFGLLTTRPDITEDVVELFHYLTGRSLKTNYKKLLVAPVSMKEKFLAMIEREIGNKKDGKPAHIIAKMNAFEEQAVGRALYKASAAGVDVDMIVRGFCVLRPRVPQLSERIRVISIIGRFLEHSRLYYFRNGAKDPLDGEFYLGSADWMYRNLNSRVEAIVPVEERALREKLWEVLQVLLNDQRQAWDMQADGSYMQRQPANEAQQIGSHAQLMKVARKTPAGSAPFVDEDQVPAYDSRQDEASRRKTRKSRRKR